MSLQLLQSMLFQMIPLAVNHNPGTGDRNAGLMWIIVAALVVSAILIIVLAVTSSQKKNKGKRK